MTDLPQPDAPEVGADEGADAPSAEACPPAAHPMKGVLILVILFLAVSVGMLYRNALGRRSMFSGPPTREGAEALIEHNRLLMEALLYTHPPLTNIDEAGSLEAFCRAPEVSKLIGELYGSGGTFYITDPWGVEMRYDLQDERITIYSAGPDGTDNYGGGDDILAIVDR